VIAVDTNVLVHAHRRDAEFHEPADAAVRELAESGSPWALPWPCLGEFYSVATSPRGYDPPSTPDEATDQIEVWRESPTLALLGEGPASWSVLRTLLLDARLRGPRVHDARIAAICLSHGVRELWTADRDYGRFPGLRTRNPLVGS
jgi:uncharacterized protein